ncbi:MAG TPA: glycosyltransferase family 2 protein, partial [Bryobacteraceae bacterium]|nr:glycosyltransferase family 2 protein [Bryobacteraceae bacterium]
MVNRITSGWRFITITVYFLVSLLNPPVAITAVVPVHNRADLLARLLRSIASQTMPFTETIVVDNASSDGAGDVAKNCGCRVIQMGENAGFARAVNRGWQAAAEGWIAILNSDVELDSRWLEHLIAEASGASFATGLILNAGNRHVMDGTYDLVSRAGCAWRAGHGEPGPTAGGASKPIAIAPATACLFRREVLEQLGGLNEAYESYLEDVDLGLRCVGGGFTGVYVPSAMAWHEGSATFGRWNPRVVRLISRNQLLLVSNNYDSTLLRAWFWPVLAGQLLWGMVALRHGAGRAWLAGKIDGLRGFHTGGTYSEPVRRFLEASEQEIATRSTDSYWRWYFRLTR